MKVEAPSSNQIIKIHHSKTAYIDEDFYKEKFDDLSYTEDSNSGMTYPVSVQALRFDWFLDDQGGHTAKFCAPSSNNNIQLELLYTIYNYENLEIYKIPAVQIIIEFLYRKQQKYFKWFSVPC